MSIGFTSAIASHVGMIRSNNQDSGFAGSQLFLVADGMGGHAGGDVASALTTRDVASIDTEHFESPDQAAKALEQRLLEANRMLSRTVQTRKELAGMGTTFCGFFAVEDQLATAHIGDSRLYLLRDGELTQQTKDHTFVQRLVDSGRITEEEAATHPRRSVLMRVLGDVDSAPAIDTAVLDTRPGDVWLLCSDGLCGYVDDDIIAQILRERDSLDEAVNQLVDVTLSHGAPDNVTVVLVETTQPAPEEDPGPRFAGSAAKEGGEGVSVDTRQMPKISRFQAAARRARKLQPAEESHFEPRVDEYLAELIAETKRQSRNRRLLLLVALVLAVGALASLVFVGYQWTQTRYFVGTDGTTVIIYQGVRPEIGPISLNSEAENTFIPLNNLTAYERTQVERTIPAGSFEEALEIVVRLGPDGQVLDE